MGRKRITDHVRRRAEERFGVRPTRRQIRKLERMIRRNESRKLGDLERGREMHHVRLSQDIYVRAVYDLDVKRIVTVW